MSLLPISSAERIARRGKGAHVLRSIWKPRTGRGVRLLLPSIGQPLQPAQSHVMLAWVLRPQSQRGPLHQDEQ